MSANLIFEFINDETEIYKFYEILIENLKKHGTYPVHSFDELMELYKNKIPENIEFCVIKNDGNDCLAGAMLFKFNKANVIHTQYLAQDFKYNNVRPMTFLYYCIINHYKNLDFKYLTWGISTEDKGKVLNKGLIKYKESFNSYYSLNRSYYKNLNFELDK